jgi:ubiquinone/menaquinone biosynthesis C-methylase UbiE
MKLNALEFKVVNNGLRNFIFSNIEFRRIRKMVSLPPKATCLEIGCGSGYAASQICKYYRPLKLKAMDLDPKMIEMAKSRYHGFPIEFSVADATSLPYATSQFDAVFEFGVLHHVPDWRKALQEIYRILKPNGIFVAEDLSKDTFETKLGRHGRKHFDHPYQKMFYKHEFIRELKDMHFDIRHDQSFFPLRLIKYFLVVADKC